MKKPINFDKVADLYDSYVYVDFDIPFFINETKEYHNEILELMCGTGRVSIPLLKVGRKLTCVDYSKEMLAIFKNKIKDYNYLIDLIEMDITKLKLDKKFGMIILPFHSLSEILTSDEQQKALKCISDHLEKGGTFILTLQNPEIRLKKADGKKQTLGEFTIDNNRKISLSLINQYNSELGLVSGYQFFEIYDSENNLIEKRKLEINFKPIQLDQLKEMILKTDMQISKIYGDYTYSEFNIKESEFMICILTKK